MKTLKQKLILTVSIILLLCNFYEKAMAQAPYKAGVAGVTVVTGYGLAFKTFIADNLAIQTDLLLRMSFPACKEENGAFLSVVNLLELNTNIMYQKN